MASGQHLSKELYDLIKSIGETRSKQEEDKIIQMDQQLLKSKISEKNIPPKKMKEYLIRAIYIEMLGHDASFAHIHAVNLAQDKTLSIKKIGYLAASLFLGPEDNLLILLVATLQRDLTSKNELEVMTALNTLTKILCPFIINAITDPVCKLLNHTNDTIRKKAVMVLHKIIKIAPTAIPDLNDKMKRALCDKDPSVMAASLNIFYDVIKQTPNKYKDLTSSFVVILKQVIEHKLSRDYDYHRIPAPWIQIKLLQILALLGANDQKTSEQIYEIVSMTMKRADDTGINIGFAITYQCVKTIASIYPNSYLLEAASNSLARFLSAEHQSNNNLKFLGINALISIVSINPKYAIEHQLVVVDCLESKDETLKRETLDLLHKMTNTGNVETIVDKLLHHLKLASDPIFKKELVNKITSLAERFAPSQEWYINTMSIILEFGSEYVDNTILNNMLKLIEENFSMNPSFGEFLIYTYLEQVKRETLSDVLAKIISWVFGEIGSKLYKEQPEWVQELSDRLLGILEYSFDDDDSTKGWILSALSKLAAIPGNGKRDEILAKFNKYSNSKYVDIQNRAIEYRVLSKYGSSSDVEVDTSLSFLINFVEEARRKGARPYDPSRRTAALIAGAGLVSGGSEKEGGELKFTPYSQDQAKARKDPNSEQTGLKVSSSKWTAQGYQEEKRDLGFTSKPMSLTSQHSKSISSKDVQEGKLGFKDDKKIFQSGGSFTSTYHQPDPREEEKKKMASALFSGLGGSNPFGIPAKTTTPTDPFKQTFQPTQKPVPTSTTQSFNPFGTTNKPPTTTTQKPSSSTANINLLDLDFNAPSTTTTTTSSTTTTTTNTSTTSPFNKGSVTGADLLGGFGFGPSQPTQTFTPTPSYSGKYQPYNIDVEQYEELWNQLSGELGENVPSSIRNVQDFNKLLQKMNIAFISESEGEVLSACKKADSGETILLYSRVQANGVLEMQYKAAQKATLLAFSAHIKEAIKS